MASSEVMELAYDLALPPQGTGEALSPIILLHGMTSSRLTWKDMPNVIASATNRKVYALDARNHGESGWTNAFDYDIMAKDVEHFMAEKDIPKAILIGHSMGGKTAMSLALAKPEKVEKLVVEDISPKRLPPDSRRFPLQYLRLQRQSLHLVDKGTDLETAKKIIHGFLMSHIPAEQRGAGSKKDDSSILAIHKLENGCFAWQANLDVIEDAIVNRPYMKRALEGLYEGDTLFIFGTESPYAVYQDKGDILKLFPKATFVPISGATHQVHSEFPEEYLKTIFEFFGN